VHARVYTFHVTREHIDDVSAVLDDTMAALSQHPDFRGLLYVERGEDRRDVLGVTLWADDGTESTEANDERSRQKIADKVDSGVCSREYRVLRHSLYQHDESFVSHLTESVMMEAG
jgi:hypothetical protein